MIIPSIDLMDGKAVQLVNGQRKVLERENPLALAREFKKYGEIAVIDLDAAMNKGSNLELVKKICKIAPCRVGGGIRTREKALELLKAGAKKIIVGTAANKELLSKLPKDKIIVAVDNLNGEVMTEAWTKSSGSKTEEWIAELEDYCNEFLVTFIENEGLMKGTKLEAVKQLRALTKNKLTIAGGITSTDETRKLEELGCNSQLGMVIYTDKLSLQDCFVSVMDFTKGLLPTIVVDEQDRPLMLAYSSKESLKKTFATEKPTYYSRSRKGLWVKGETSGNTQELIQARYDCDRDSLVFKVRQKNVACHTGAYSCFSDKEFKLQDLYDVVAKRISNPCPDSYTSKISNDERKICSKIVEEAGEVACYSSRKNLVEEVADLTYFVTVLLAKKGISFEDIENELRGRMK